MSWGLSDFFSVASQLRDGDVFTFDTPVLAGPRSLVSWELVAGAEHQIHSHEADLFLKLISVEVWGNIYAGS